MSNKNFIKKITERLLEEQAILLKSASSKPEIDADGDEMDKIQGNILIELHHQFTTRNTIKLTQIADSLQRIADKTYGICEDCEEEIPEKRLIINPYFLTCVNCAEEREAEDKQRKKLSS